MWLRPQEPAEGGNNMLTLDELWYGNIGYESRTSGDREYSRETKKLLALSEK